MKCSDGVVMDIEKVKLHKDEEVVSLGLEKRIVERALSQTPLQLPTYPVTTKMFQRWLFPYDYQIVQEIQRHESDAVGVGLLDIGNQLSPEDEIRYAFAMLPKEKSKHTGFAFDSPGYESFFATQQGVAAPQKAWIVVRRASMKPKDKKTLE